MSGQKLREYQRECLKQVGEHLKAGKKRILITMPPGCGKGTVLAQIISSTVKAGKTGLFVVHRRELVHDISQRISRLGAPHALVQPGWYPIYNARFYVSTIQSWLSNVQRQKIGAKPDFIIIDEAHRINPSDGMYKRMLDMYPGVIIIMFTASPCRGDGKGLGAVAEVLVQPINYEQAFNEGFLCRPKYFVPTDLDLSKVAIKAGDYDPEELGPIMEAPKMVGDVVAHYLAYTPYKKAVGFAVRVTHSKAMADAFNAAGIPSAHIDGTTPKAERDQIFQDWRDSKILVVWNVSVCSEGIDIPDIEVVIHCKPTKSVINWIQEPGRAFRPSPDKEHAIVLDHGGTYNRLGPVESYTEWSLEDRKGANRTAGERNKAREKEIKTIKCYNCKSEFSGSIVCPSCGYVHNSARLPGYIEGDLVEAKGGKVPKKKVYTEADKQEWLSGLEYIRLSRQFSRSWIRDMYHSKFKEYPSLPEHIVASAPGIAVTNWIKHMAIKRSFRQFDRKAAK